MYCTGDACTLLRGEPIQKLDRGFAHLVEAPGIIWMCAWNHSLLGGISSIGSC